MHWAKNSVYYLWYDYYYLWYDLLLPLVRFTITFGTIGDGNITILTKVILLLYSVRILVNTRS